MGAGTGAGAGAGAGAASIGILSILSWSLTIHSLNSCISVIADGFLFLLEVEDRVDTSKGDDLRLNEAGELGMSKGVEDDDAPGVDEDTTLPRWAFRPLAFDGFINLSISSKCFQPLLVNCLKSELC